MTRGASIHHVDANGLRFAYLEARPDVADAPLVLLLHGFPDSAHSWDALRPQLAARGYRAVAPWMRGYAPTAIPARDADLETLGRDVLALITALGHTSAIVVGHDWGAAASYAAAALGPDRIRKLVAIAIPHPAVLKPTPRKLWAARHFVAFKIPGAAQRFARDNFAALPEIYRRWSPAWSPSADELAPVRAVFANPASLDAAFGYYRELKFRPQSFLRAKLAAPTIAFAGLGDHLLGVEDFEVARRMFTGSYTIETLPGGHFMHREHPEAFAAKLFAHL